MSYAREVKEELCTINNSDNHCQMAELEALIRLNSEIIISNGTKIVSFSSSSAIVSKRFLTLLKEYIKCEVSLVSKKVNKRNQSNVYYVNVLSMSELLMEEFGLLSDSKNKEDIFSRECCKASYLRGAFLAKGSVNDPSKSDYHLEMYTGNEKEALFIQRVMNSFDLNAKIVKRRTDLVIYLKDIQSIKDFLRVIGTSKMVFKLEEIQINRSVSSSVARIINIEGANDQKTLSAAKDQIRNIRYLEYNYPLEKLDSKILLIMKVRKENPEASFNELIDILNDRYGEQITKSGLNHRFRKIKEIAKAHEDARKLK